MVVLCYVIFFEQILLEQFVVPLSVAKKSNFAEFALDKIYLVINNRLTK